MLRDKLKEELKASMLSGNAKRTGTLRLMLAAIKDKDIASRTEASKAGITDPEIFSLFTSMIKQRNDSIDMYKKGGREELAAAEADEIAIITEFLPRQLSDDEISSAIAEAIKETGAEGMKDTGKVIKALKDKYAGQLDFSKAAGLVKSALTSA